MNNNNNWDAKFNPDVKSTPVVLDVRAPHVDIGALGQLVSFDRTKLSKTTVQNSVSHINVLRRNGVTIDEVNLTHNTVDMLDRLVDRKNKPLTMDYKRQIGMTIKRLYPNARINLSKYNVDRRRRNRLEAFNTQNDSAIQYVQAVKMVRDQSINVLRMAQNQQAVDDLGLYDAAVAVLLTIATSLRIRELWQLRLEHMPEILKSQRITIHSKSNKNVRSIAPNDLLKHVFTTIEQQRPLVTNNIAMKNNQNIRQQIERLNSHYILISSDDFMTKKLKDLAAMAGVTAALPTFGFNTFRRYITSTLVEGGGHYVAQSMNNHSNLDTTLDHYLVVGPESMQRTYKNLLEAIDDVDTAPQ